MSFVIGALAQKLSLCPALMLTVSLWMVDHICLEAYCYLSILISRVALFWAWLVLGWVTTDHILQVGNHLGM